MFYNIFRFIVYQSFFRNFASELITLINMKKSILFLAMLLCSFAASAKVINAVPAGDISWYLKQAEVGDVIEMADGTYDEAYAITFSVENLTIKAAEGAKPVIALTGEWTSLKLAATTTFEGITFDGGGVAYYPITIEGENTGIFTFNNCEFKNYQYYAISNNNASNKTNVNSVVVNNCIFHDGGSAIYMNEEAACANLTVQNTTIYNFAGVDAGKAAIHIAEVTSDATFATQTLIDHVTIYNIQTSSSIGAITIVNASETTISNSIIASPEQNWVDSYNVPAEATIQNCLVYNQHLDAVWTSTITNADPMFVDAANGNFQLYAESPAVGAGTDDSNIGDPRWGVKAGLRPGSKVLSKAVAAAAPGATITLGDGVYEEASSFDFNKEGVTIVAAEGTKPVIKTLDQWTSLGIAASTTFEGITFDGGNLTKTSLDTKGTTTQTLTLRKCEFKNYTDYNINIESSTAINTINIDNCIFDGVEATKAAIYAKGIVTTCQITNSEFKNYAEYCISASDYYRGRFDNLSINNCLLHDGTVAVYMPKYADAGDIQTCANFSLTNSTIYNMVCTKAVIDIRSNPDDAIENLNKVVIDHITIYNYDATNGAIYIAKTNDMSITNSIIATPEDKGQRALYVYGGTVDNTIHFNGSKRSGNTVYTKCENVDPMFVGATEANFDIYANSPAVGAGTDGSTLGDPRWGVSAKVLGKRINVTPDQASSLPWMIQSDESNVKAGDTIVMAGGTYELSSFELRKEGLVIMAAENAEVKIATKEGEYLKIVATTTFDGITFDGSNVANYAIRSIGTSAKNLIVRNCKFTQYSRYNIYGADGTHMDSLVVDNCIFSNSGAAIYFPASTLADNVPGCSYAKVTNSTLYNIILNDYVASIDIQENNNAKQTGNTEVVIDHVTIYNFSSTAKSAIKVYKSGKTNITNSIVANPAESEMKSFMIYDGAKVQNCLNFNSVGQWASNAYTDTICADPLFVDAANNDFMLQANSPAIGAGTDGSNLGDPRWGVAEPAFITLTTGDNSAVIAANIGKTVDVVIERSFTANDGYYTICLPFNIAAEEIGKAYQVTSISDAGAEGFYMVFNEVTELVAGQPYLIEPKDLTNPIFENVTISYTGNGETVAATNSVLNFEMVGVINGGGKTDHGQYWVGDNGYFYNGDGTSTTDKLGLRVLFNITDKNDQPVNIRARVVVSENTTTGFENITTTDKAVKIIENGQLIIIRNGEKFNAQGVKF